MILRTLSIMFLFSGIVTQDKVISTIFFSIAWCLLLVDLTEFNKKGD